MKRKNFFIILILLLAIALNLGKSVDPKIVYADEIPKTITTIGESEMAVEPDTMLIDFCIKKLHSNFLEGQENIMSIYSDFCTNLQNLDDSCICNLTYMSCFPITKKNDTKYDFSANILVETSKSNNLSEIIKLAGNCGING